MPERSIVRVRCTRLHALRTKLNGHINSSMWAVN